ncbi:hypothetical protein QFW96_23865 [Saccharopolyspora sp. TS4A08]|uniref:XRE family transcriptional regulator n=1 Tax=Saccharopolyspora ipomoeae TaxID=3042027 RepID=A0ABT6PUP0_9PSEU|nr:hypothetical protein [Saccharopolyspora sp. TS4A08]MDI2031686.1 hypothetical protein [Saccharopolyspora sp. TS4A08]
MLEQKIRERRQTLEEFTEYTERFAREHDEPGTLSLRHLQRLITGRGANGQPLGPVRAVTARLLERIFGLSIDELLSPPRFDDETAELRQMLDVSRRIDGTLLDLLRGQLDSIRRVDRQLGAVVAYEEVRAKASQVEKLFTHSLPGNTRQQLAVILTELHTLAGWQALDLGKTQTSWRHYERARHAARETGTESYEIHTGAEQAFVLLDLGETRCAVDLLHDTRRRARSVCPMVLRSWLAAAHGEALAAHDQRSESLSAFDDAAELLPSEQADPISPYVALDAVHLTRWRGHALARFADPAAVDVLARALDELDKTFTRAETALRVDLAMALIATGEHDSVQAEVVEAKYLAAAIGSARQQKRLKAL